MGVYAKIKKAGTQSRFSTITEEIESQIMPEIWKFVKKAEKNVYEHYADRFISNEVIDTVRKELSFAASEQVDLILAKTAKLSGTLFTAQGVTDSKALNTLISYVKNDFGSDMSDMILSVKSQTEKALNHISYVVNMQATKDVGKLYKELSQYTGDNLKKDLQAFQRVFSDQYARDYMREMTMNPVLNSLIKQEGNSLFFYNKNGRRYDIDKYLKARGEFTALDTMRKAQLQVAKERGYEVFRLERIKNAVDPREHSKYEGDYFTKNTDLVGTELNGKVINGDIITDFIIGSTPPYGCGHIYVAVEMIENSENIQENDKKDENNEKNNENSGIIKKELSADTIIKECIKKSSITNEERTAVLSEFAKKINKDIIVEIEDKGDNFGWNDKIRENYNDDKIYIGKIGIKMNDDRPYEYKLKTIFHEITHLRNHNKVSVNDIEYFLYNRDRRYNIEEVIAETTGHYQVKSKYGINKTIYPSYPKDMASSLPNLKKIKDFENCVNIEDFGEVFYNKYINNTDAVKQITMQLNKLDYTSPDDYIKSNLKRIIDNKDDIVNIYYDIFKDAGDTKEEINNYINNIDNINDLNKCRIISALFAVKGV